MRIRRPTVFSVTVFPPAFGPVITRVLKSGPTSILSGTTLPSSRGCLPFTIFICLLRFISGIAAFMLIAYLAFANIKS